MGRKARKGAWAPLVFGVFEEKGVEKAVNAAYDQWPRAEDAWETVKDVVVRDPMGAGEAVTESGKTRSFTFDGASSIGLPSISVVYVVEDHNVVIRDVKFYEASYGVTGTS